MNFEQLTLNEKIEILFDVLVKNVIDNDYIKNHSEVFYRIIKENRLKSKTTDNVFLMKLAILSSHQEWEIVYQMDVIGSQNVLGAEARDIIGEGCDYYGVNFYELKLLRNEIIYEDPLNFYLKNRLEFCNAEYEYLPDYFNLKRLIDVNLKLKKAEESTTYIELLSNYLGKDATVDIDCAMFKAMLQFDILRFQDIAIDCNEIRKIIGLFEENEVNNKFYGLYDHVSYLQYYIEMISIYLYEKRDEVEETAQVMLEEHSDSNYFIFTKVTQNYEELLMFADQEIMDLMKTHDRIILDIIPLITDPALFVLGSDPIFRGTTILMERMLLNLNFSNKLEYFLQYSFLFERDYLLETEYDINPNYTDLLKERLINEFPKDKPAIDIKFARNFLDYRSKRVNRKKLIKELQPYYWDMIQGVLLDDYHAENLNETCVLSLIECYLLENTEDEAVNIASYCIENNGSLKFDLLSIISHFYDNKSFKLYIQLATNVLDKLSLKDQVNDFNLQKVLNNIKYLMSTLGESFIKIGEKEKAEDLLKYFENSIFGLSVEDYEYEELKDLCLI